MEVNIENLTRDEKSALVYAETCLVDYAGLLEGQRMNSADIEAFQKFKDAGLIDFGRIPYKVIGSLVGVRQCTHWIEFTDAAWSLVHSLRRSRADQSKANSVNRKKLDEFFAGNDAVQCGSALNESLRQEGIGR